MNKFGLILLLIASVCSITEDEIYEAVVRLVKGMAETEEAACSAVLVKQKEKILEIVHQAIDEINSGVDSSTAIQNALIKLMGVDGLVSECNVLAMPAIITKVTSKDGLVDIFQTCIDKIDEIYSYGEEIKAAFDEKDYYSAAEAFGHILSIALDFQVNL
jgi:hypothetical protein